MTMLRLVFDCLCKFAAAHIQVQIPALLTVTGQLLISTRWISFVSVSGIESCQLSSTLSAVVVVVVVVVAVVVVVVSAF